MRQLSSGLSLVPQRGVKHAQVPCRDWRRVRLEQRRRRRSGRRTRRHAAMQSPRQPLQPAARHTLLQRQAFICIEQQNAQDSCSLFDSNVHVLPALRRAAGSASSTRLRELPASRSQFTAANSGNIQRKASSIDSLNPMWVH